MVCEKGIFKVESINNLLVPQNSKTILNQKPYTFIKKTGMHYTNCHKTNHNLKHVKSKNKIKIILVVFKVTTQQIKIQRPMGYSCHICDEIRHRITDYPKFNDM